MPGYFFDTHDGETYLQDEKGVTLAGIEDARTEAQTTLADMVRDALPDGDQKTIAVQVRDEAGKTVIKAAISILVEVEP